MNQLSNEAWIANQRKKKAIGIALQLYFDTLQYWYVQDFFAWRAWIEEVWKEEWWRRTVAHIQAHVHADERARLCRLRRNRTTRALRYAAWWERAGRPMQ